MDSLLSEKMERQPLFPFSLISAVIFSGDIPPLPSPIHPIQPTPLLSFACLYSPNHNCYPVQFPLVFPMDIKQLAAVLLEVIQENRDLKTELATLRSDFQSLSSSVTDLKSSVSDLRMKTGTLITKTSLEQKRNTQQRATVEQWNETVEGRQKTLEANMEELKNLVKFGPPPLAHLSAIKKDEELENEKKKGRISPKKLIAISPVKPGRSPAPPQPFQFDNSEVFFSQLRDPEETKVSHPPPPFLSPSQNHR